MERVSVRICCGGTAVPAVAPRSGMCCTHVERELQSSVLTYHRQLPAQFFHLSSSANSFCTKAPLPWPCTHPIDDSSYLTYGLGRDTEREREQLVLIPIFKCYGNTEIMIMNRIIIKIVP